MRMFAIACAIAFSTQAAAQVTQRQYICEVYRNENGGMFGDSMQHIMPVGSRMALTIDTSQRTYCLERPSECQMLRYRTERLDSGVIVYHLVDHQYNANGTMVHERISYLPAERRLIWHTNGVSIMSSNVLGRTVRYYRCE